MPCLLRLPVTSPLKVSFFLFSASLLVFELLSGRLASSGVTSRRTLWIPVTLSWSLPIKSKVLRELTQFLVTLPNSHI
uniref:Secreted protein n=1 Tax=Steinernema glaseri TaxID=37863 RepID=A0A1I7YH82_9BILA